MGKVRVSIHTPTQGVTVYIHFHPFCIVVSIHTPTQGVTKYRKNSYLCPSSFNPHTHAGCDIGISGDIHFGYVSIHTPTQGVTIGGWSSVININVSIHTPTQGVTLLTSLVCKPFLLCFNPHTHAGCDVIGISGDIHFGYVSIHTPTQGVTFIIKTGIGYEKFQSTHPRRV